MTSHFIRSVYFLDMLKLIKYYLVIKVSSIAVRNIYKIRNLSYFIRIVPYFNERYTYEVKS